MSAVKRKLDGASAPKAKSAKLSSSKPSKHAESESSAETTPAPAPEATSENAVQKTFKDLGVIDSICEAADELGWKKPTPIQAESIPIALSGRDIIGLAETGSGKTGAFLIPILQDLLEKQSPLFGLILAPTRELAYQIGHSAEALGSVMGVKVAVITGGMDMVPQSIALGKKPHLIVATPGRLLDHLENSKGFSLRKLQYLVMDEADRLLDLDFGPILDKILKVLPKEGRKTYLFSATMSSKVESLQRASLSNPVRVSISSSSHQTVQTLIQSFLIIPHKHKDAYLVHLVNEFVGHPAIIFCRTVNEAHRISILLRTLGFSAIPIHGQLSQSSRLAALNKFRTRSRDILVATDVAARGLDIPSVDLVLNFDLPADSKTYVHRVGRTARAGKSGKAISLVTQYDAEIWQRIEQALGKKLPLEEVPKEEVMVLMERVGEAQRVAIREMKDMHEGRGKNGGMRRKGRSGKRDEMDKEEG